jgi:hypothetical protein
MVMVARIGGGSVRHRPGWSLYLGRGSLPSPAGCQPSLDVRDQREGRVGEPTELVPVSVPHRHGRVPVTDEVKALDGVRGDERGGGAQEQLTPSVPRVPRSALVGPAGGNGFGGQRPASPERADVTLNLDMAKLPPLDVAVPEIKIGKGTRCSTVELRQPEPTIGFEPIHAAYKAK